MAKDPLAGLTEKQRLFVEAYIESIGIRGHQKRAAIAAGYSEDSASQEASRLLRLPKIADAISHLAKIRVSRYTYLAVKGAVEFAQGYRTVRDVDPHTKELGEMIPVTDVTADQQLKALAFIADRGGLPVAKDVQVTADVTHTQLPDTDLRNRILTLLSRAGALPAPTQAALAPPIDVPCEELSIKEVQEMRAAELVENKEKRIVRAQQFEDVRSANQHLEETEIKANARADFKLEREEWDDE